MPRNIEIKARVPDLDALAARAAALATEGPLAIPQDDTFFQCPAGRLKLRAFSAGEGELIFYRRADAKGPKESFYVRSPTNAPDTLREALTLAYGQVGRVRKHRTLYLAGRTRIHLDRVEGLGHFMELEVVLSGGEGVAAGEREARALMEKLGVTEDQLVQGAYLDLLQGARTDGGPASLPTRRGTQHVPVDATIVPATTADLDAILALNLQSERFLSPLTPQRLRELFDMAAYCRVARREGRVLAFLLVFREGAAYDSPNYTWFAQRYPRFAYIDRVVVAHEAQGAGLGRALYADLFAWARAQGIGTVTCEFDVEPPNPVSARFHAGFGFREVGAQWVQGGKKRVSLQEAAAT